MPLYINRQTVTIVRDGRRLKVKPTGAPFDFTADEVAEVRAAGGIMESQGAPAVAQVVAAPAPKTEATSGKPKGKGKAKEAETDDEDGDL